MHKPKPGNYIARAPIMRKDGAHHVARKASRQKCARDLRRACDDLSAGRSLC